MSSSNTRQPETTLDDVRQHNNTRQHNNPRPQQTTGQGVTTKYKTTHYYTNQRKTTQRNTIQHTTAQYSTRHRNVKPNGPEQSRAEPSGSLQIQIITYMRVLVCGHTFINATLLTDDRDVLSASSVCAPGFPACSLSAYLLSASVLSASGCLQSAQSALLVYKTFGLQKRCWFTKHPVWFTHFIFVRTKRAFVNQKGIL